MGILMAICPICNHEATSKYLYTPYWDCKFCSCWFQYPVPPKVYEADHEKTETGDFAGHLMGDYEKEVNRNLAKQIHSMWFSDAPIKTLDVGSKYPYLSSCFRDMGCESYAMDNIEIVPEYSKELNIPMLMADFENITELQIREWTKTDKFDLITMIHVFEHMYNPLEALRKLKALLKDDGVLFIRIPGHDVTGFERDLTEGHYTIHPFFHTLESLLELLVQAKDLFTIDWTVPMEGAGQRDLVLRPIHKKPTICAGMIVKNEERDLPKCLKSIETAVDGVVIIDTGSTDSTLEVAKNTPIPIKALQTYTGASEQDATGDWKLWSFSKARNVFIDLIDDDLESDYVLWMDADDTLVTPESIRRASYLSAYKVIGFMIEAGDKWVHHRMWRARMGVRFEGAIHEYPTHGGHADFIFKNSIIRHDAAPGTGENSNNRNLRILEKEYAEAKTSRTVFYLANTHKDAYRWEEAVKYYDERITMGEYFRDEWLFAYLYKARCERSALREDDAEKTLLEALSKAPWAEFWMELSYIHIIAGRLTEAKATAMMASVTKNTPTSLWRENNKYTDQPLRAITMCYEQEGDIETALTWAYKTKIAIGVSDSGWDEKIASLESRRVL